MIAVVLLSLCSAVAFGLSDFIGGLVTRRASAWTVAAVSQATATLIGVGMAAASIGSPRPEAFAWGAVAGLGSGAGNVLIYRGLSGGRMAVVAPLSAIASALLPVIVGLLSGERPGLLPVAGVAAALPAIWLVAGGASLSGARRADVLDGVLAGAGFGVQFSALGQIPSQAGLTPLALSQAVSVVAIVAAASSLRQPWFPRDRVSRFGALAGLCAGLAAIAFQLAVQHGLLTLAAVLTSLYPAVTVLLAALVLRERVSPSQGAGLLLALLAVALIAAG